MNSSNPEENRKSFDAKKNSNRQLCEMLFTCSKHCFLNLKTTSINDDENICLQNCFNKYYQIIEAADDFTHFLEKGEIKINISSENFIGNLTDQLKSKLKF